MRLNHSPNAAHAPKPNGSYSPVVLAAHTAGATSPLTPARWPRLLSLIAASCRRLGLPQVGAAKAVAPTQGDVSRRLRLARRRRTGASAGLHPLPASALALYSRKRTRGVKHVILRCLWDWTCAACALAFLVALYWSILLLGL